MQKMMRIAAILLVFTTTPGLAKETLETLETAIFAGGCFWCMEKPFDRLDGVKETFSGYTGGHKKSPTYKQVSSGRTGHTEAIKITFDPQVISYQALLEVFWRNIDPFDGGGQFCDRGKQYRSGIFYASPAQQQAALSSLEKLKDHFNDLVISTEITPASAFYPAETYHQNYYKKNPLRYKYYRYRCGRDQRLKDIWGKPLP